MLTNDLKKLQLNFNDFLTSNSHSKTREIQQQIQLINNGLDNVKLDYEFHRTSKPSNIQDLIEKGNDLVQQMNIRLHANQMKTKELNQIREEHNWALDSLNEYLEILQPRASSSYARLDNMAHQLGVTDRFVGYRNNLTRYGSQPTIWADRKLPLNSTPNWKDWAYAFQHNSQRQVPVQSRTSYSSMATTHPTVEEQRPPSTTIKNKKLVSRSFNYSDDYNSQMIRAGRSIVYPGQSETIDRFKKSPPRSYTPSFVVAQPDFTRIGRPLARLVSKSSCSESIDRYTFPDSSNLERYPWLRP